MLALSAARDGGLSSTKSARGRTARERLEPERTAAGEEVEDPGAGQRVLQDAHPGLAHPIGGGPHPRVARAPRRAPAELATDDSHTVAPEPHRSRQRAEAALLRMRASARRSAPAASASPMYSFCSSRKATSTCERRRRGQPRNPIGPLEADRREPLAVLESRCP